MNRIVIGLFLAALWIPFAGMLIGRSQVGISGENRRLAGSPWRFNEYFHDHFGFRGSLIILQALLKVRVFGVSSSPDVVVGKHGWLYFAGDQSLDSPPFTEQELAAWVRLFRTRQEWLSRRSIRFAVVIAPDKHTIYPENLPWNISTRRVSRLDRLTPALQQAGVSLIDIRPALMQAKAGRHPLYYETDSHWNGYGTFAGYQRIASDLGLQPIPMSECRDSVRDGSGDLASMLGLRRQIHERMVSCEAQYPMRNPVGTSDLVVLEQDGPVPRRLLMFDDSFGAPFIPLLSRHFTRSAFSRSYSLQPELVEKERPDLVIVELVERRLNWDPPLDSLPSSEPKIAGAATALARASD